MSPVQAHSWLTARPSAEWRVTPTPTVQNRGILCTWAEPHLLAGLRCQGQWAVGLVFSLPAAIKLQHPTPAQTGTAWAQRWP